MIIEQTKDRFIIDSVMKHPEIIEAISGDKTIEEAQACEAPINSDWLYLKGVVDGVVVGLVVVHLTSQNWYQGHVQVLPEYRAEHAFTFGHDALEWIWDNTVIPKLIALVPELYPNVKKFLDAQGFTQEGYITNSYKKNGRIYSNWLMSKNRGQ